MHLKLEKLKFWLELETKFFWTVMCVNVSLCVCVRVFASVNVTYV